MTLMQSKGNRLRANASLAMGDGKKVDAALQAAAAQFGTDQRSEGRDAAILDVAEELPLTNIPRMVLDAVVVLTQRGLTNGETATCTRSGTRRNARPALPS